MSQSVVQAYPPVQVPICDRNGVATPVWVKWFESNYIQTGGSSSTTLTSLIATVATQAAEIAALQAQIANLVPLQNQVNGLSVGRQL